MSRKYSWKLVGENVLTGDLHKNRAVVDRPWRWIKLFVVVAFSVLISRAFFLQVFLGEMNAKKADENRIDLRKVASDRGVIVDRHGEVLARNGLYEDKLVREYLGGESTAHVVGYVGDGIEVKEGKMGIERGFDEYLRGSLGEELVEEDARGKPLRVLRQKEPVAGGKLQLTIDKKLQEHIVTVLREREVEKKTVGAVVVSKVETGEILALVSWPSFDPNLFSGLKSQDIYRYRDLGEVLGDKDGKPLFNRALAAYPPGSVFKLVSAMAGLEERAINSETIVDDTGEIKIGPYRYGNWYFDQYGRTEGPVDLTKALARSNDIYFYKVGEWVGIDKLADWAKKFGLGQKTGIKLSGESSGSVPDRKTKERLTGERWFLGNTYHTSIGQGDLLSSPLQVNLFTGAVMSGKLCKPILVAGGDIEKVNCQDLGVGEENSKLIIGGMLAACSSGGTAFPFFDAPYKAACKTGTAQHGGEKTEPHAWITVVIPNGEDYEKGTVVTVFLEEAGEGSWEAGPVARKIADKL